MDAELVRRGLARSRGDAADLISAGRVKVRGSLASKPATAIDADTPVLVAEHEEQSWVSRGAHKLLGALAAFEPQGLLIADRRCLDAGASTGGFTEVLLCKAAAEVVAVDVGYGQLAWRLRTDDRVRVVERTNVRHLEPEMIGGTVALVVSDLSFISLRMVLPALAACTEADGDLVLMVKPQFEVGKERVGAKGVVRDPELRADAVRQVVAAAGELGLTLRAVIASPLPGPSGNVEYFVWLRRGVPIAGEESAALIADAVREGPQ